MDVKEYIGEWLKALITGLVQFPDEVRVTVTSDEMGVLFTVFSNPSDHGKIIGREGKTANAVRQVLRVCGMSRNVRAALKIDAPLLRGRSA